MYDPVIQPPCICDTVFIVVVNGARIAISRREYVVIDIDRWPIVLTIDGATPREL